MILSKNNRSVGGAQNRGTMEHSSSTATFVNWALLVAAVFSIFPRGSAAQQAPAPSTPEPPSASHSALDSSHTDAPRPALAPDGHPGNNQRTDQVKNGNGAAADPKQTSGISKDRLFFVVPNFLTLEDAGSVPPLTTAEKYKTLTRSSFDYVK